MKRKYFARLVFPSIFHEYQFNKKDFKQKKLIDFCYSEKKQNIKGLTRSNKGGWHSRIYNINEDNIISEHIKKGLGKSIFTCLNKNLEVNLCYWIMINSPNTYNTRHTHPNSNISGVFWIKTPNNSGDLKFINPNSFEAFVELNCYVEKFKLDTNSYESYQYKPVAGNMITFPSHVLHEVLLNESKEDRIAVSYNITLKGWEIDDN